MKMKKMAEADETPPPPLHDDACPRCGTTMREAQGRFEHPVNGETIEVLGISHLRCPDCGEVVFRLDEARQLRENALAQYRQKYGLLSAAEIRAIRERLGLSQGELGKLLGLGSNTLSRWEANRNVQSASLDVLLRLLRDVPTTLPYLRALRGRAA